MCITIIVQCNSSSVMGCKEVHVVHLATGTGSLAHRQLEVSKLSNSAALCCHQG